MGQWHSLGGDARTGTSAAQTRGYGLIGGIGIGNRDWSLGAFGGTLDSRQRIGRTIATASSRACRAAMRRRSRPPRPLTGVARARRGRCPMATAPLPATAQLGRRPVGRLCHPDRRGLGGDAQGRITYVRTIRNRATETGSILGLTVARDRHDAIFGDAAFRFAWADASDAAFRPYVGLDLCAQYKGRMPTAIGGYAGAPLALVATGAQRAKMVGTVSAALSYCLNSGLELFPPSMLRPAAKIIAKA